MSISRKLFDSLMMHEGLRNKPYKDTNGHLTVGIGRNLDVNGLSDEECHYLFNNDLKKCQRQLETVYWYRNLDEVRREVMIELCFNLGLRGLLGFKLMIQHIMAKNFEYAAYELLDSKWRKDVGPNRAHNVSERLRTGRY